MNRILIIIVRYKKKLGDIEPLKYFERYNAEILEYFIYDNSPDALLDIDLRHPFTYIHDPNNSGISRAYNMGANHARENGFEWIMLFDQDTKIRDYHLIYNIEAEIHKCQHINLFVPIVFYDKGVMSPRVCRYFRPRNRYLGPGIHELKNVSIINSGLIVSTAEFICAGGYNENVLLDFADYQFIERFQKRNDKFVVLNSVLYQDFSNNETDILKIQSRFNLYCKSLKRYETHGFRRGMLLYTGLLHSMALSKRTGKLTFIFQFIKYMCS